MATAPTGASLLQPTAKTAEVVTITTFAQESVKILRESDFNLSMDGKAPLRYSNCIVVLFYAENRESKNVVKVWAEAASQVAGAVPAACNLASEKRVAEFFTRLSSDANNPYHWAGLQQIPFILTFRDGYPQAFYNGDRSVVNFVDYMLTLACRAGYVEKQQLTGGMQAENRFEVTGVRAFQQPLQSTDFKGGNGVRGYDARFPPVVQGSAEEKKELEIAAAERAAQPVLQNTVPVQTSSPVTTGEGVALPPIAQPLR